MASLTLRQVQKSFGEVPVIRGVDLDVKDGEFCVFVGPSGCGKSTLLRLIAGLEGTTDGTVKIGDRDVTRLAPAERGVSMVFQSYALYPHMTVAENIGFGMKMAKMPKPEIQARTAKAAKMLHLTELLNRRPAQLSGGQRQRVAIGRAIVREPDVFLFDEPLSNLDAALRVQMRIEISRLHNDLKATMIYVTHDQVEAMTMADKIVVLSAGRIEQVGSPLELYHKPNNLFVATFIGSPKMNLFNVTVKEVAGNDAIIALPGGSTLAVPTRGASIKPGPITMGVRPEHLTIAPTESGIPGKVVLSEHLGGETMIYVDVEGTESTVVKADGLAGQRSGDTVRIIVDPKTVHLFDKDGQALVNGSLI
ncbi:MAG: sn-glycerol-3-phosphate ABC transporter ATP-binding protein UgpC [Bosea sp.]|jgi:multiple sugar transport system ATP-binding protein|uniref:Multiple sugar transport system ATP-binding protein n=1 Tax=Kaistia geumhonensis TaxID=410839 RepID=A0ABU0M3X0_9HYPH|nr:sn-glycerol-3-phosphate ABC transporter ATP-binding protein UgpC [Kaistia geumhonensis]MBN9434524.1 sn-glycerol-3-phosphate ABC transporter ATP-binding protein UgpC [Bosea sp. (in: a-proteobacteria)]MCX5479134.1 sn-glycerol-3-phosphate ABC transporter ATP-binding protein UgpC [Kaistia geumhonensis]MDQ0515646.1 multiple sugar transport system ATP-binding protein [Kaistia geumhonensis]